MAISCIMTHFCNLPDPRKPLGKRHVLGDMLNVIHHRGPDDSGVYFDKDVALGMRRLSIIDLSGGKQPISNEDGTIWVVFNGGGQSEIVRHNVDGFVWNRLEELSEQLLRIAADEDLRDRHERGFPARRGRQHS